MAEIIAVASHQSGVGKTALVQNLAYELSTQRVLVVDFDPQAQLTIDCGLDPTRIDRTIYHALHEPDRAEANIIALNGFDILPATETLALVEGDFLDQPDRHDRFKDVLAQLDALYDYILIDSSPSVRFFAFNAPNAATQLLMLLPSMESTAPDLQRVLAQTFHLLEIFRWGNPLLELRAVVQTMVDPRRPTQGVGQELIRQRFGATVIEEKIPADKAIAAAAIRGVPVARHAPKSAGALAYKTLAKDLYGTYRS
jgi:chromosome partitioning protein